jgi:hypothetical protein
MYYLNYLYLRNFVNVKDNLHKIKRKSFHGIQGNNLFQN